MSQSDEPVPISSLFFSDAGPHIVRAGFPSREAQTTKPTPARGHELRSLLNTSIAQLGAVSGETRRRTPAPLPPPVAIDTLLYRGAAALDRALEIRSEIVTAQRAATREEMDELLDLILLASDGD
jgi:hypothetical protein